MKLLVAIRHHGLGHLAQVAPVINALAARPPKLALTIWSRLDEALLRRRAIGIDTAALASPMIRQQLDALCSLPTPPTLHASGAEQAAAQRWRSRAK